MLLASAFLVAELLGLTRQKGGDRWKWAALVHHRVLLPYLLLLTRLTARNWTNVLFNCGEEQPRVHSPLMTRYFIPTDAFEVAIALIIDG